MLEVFQIIPDNNPSANDSLTANLGISRQMRNGIADRSGAVTITPMPNEGRKLSPEAASGAKCSGAFTRPPNVPHAIAANNPGTNLDDFGSARESSDVQGQKCRVWNSTEESVMMCDRMCRNKTN